MDKAQKINPLTFLLFNALIVVFFFALRTSQLDRFAGLDELLTFNTSLNYFENGKLGILDGTYKRSFVYTYLAGLSVGLTGIREIISARLVSLGFDLVMILFVANFVLLRLGVLCAALSVFLILTWPNGIHLSQTARFYTAQTLFFTISIVAMFLVARGNYSRPTVFLIAITGLACIFLSLHMQLTSIVALTFAGAWTFFYVLLTYQIYRMPLFNWTAVAVVATALVVLFLYQDSALSFVQELIKNYRFVPPWDEAKASYIAYYFNVFLSMYPLLISAMVLILLAGLRVDRDLIIFLAVIVFPSLAVYSFAGAKGTRYIYHLIPAFMVLTAIGLTGIWRTVVDASKTLPNLQTSSIKLGMISLLFIGSVLVTNKFTLEAAKVIFKDKELSRDLSWTKADEVIRGIRRLDTVLITDSDVHTVYYVGDFDYHYSDRALELIDWFSQRDTRSEVQPDPRTGRRTIGTPSVLSDILTCAPHAIVIGDRQLMREGLDRLETFRERLDLLAVDVRSHDVGPDVMLFEVSRKPEQDPKPVSPDCQKWSGAEMLRSNS